MSFLVFDIETRIDKGLIRATQYRGEAVSDEEAYRRMRDEARRQSDGRSDFLPLSFHLPICVAMGSVGADHVLRQVEVLKADVLGEAGLVRAFWERLEAFDGTLVSFNGRGFDLPVLELNGLRHGCAAPRYFNQRGGLRARFGRHYDLYDFLCNSGAARLRGGFDLVAKLVGLPGKGEVTGGDVQELWEAGRLDEIHRYCCRDVIQTYFVFLHVERLRGRISSERLSEVEKATRAFRDELGAARE